MMLGCLASTVSMSLICFAESKPASVSATTSTPSRANSSLAPAVTAFTKSDEVCQRRAAVAFISLIFATSASVSITSLDSVGLSPPGPTVWAIAAVAIHPIATAIAVSLK